MKPDRSARCRGREAAPSLAKEGSKLPSEQGSEEEVGGRDQEKEREEDIVEQVNHGRTGSLMVSFQWSDGGG